MEIRVAFAAGWLRQAVETKPAAGAVRHGDVRLPANGVRWLCLCLESLRFTHVSLKVF